MASIKVLLWNKANKDGLFPVVIRITSERKPAYLYSTHYLKSSQWDEKEKLIIGDYPESDVANLDIVELKGRIQKFMILNNVKERRLSGPQIKAEFIKATKRQRGSLFFPFALEIQKEKEQEGKFNEVGTLKSQLKYYKQFGGDKLTFEDIDKEHLRKFKRWLKIHRKVSERTQADYLMTIRSIYNRAIAKGIVEKDSYPFGAGGMKIKYRETLKIGLSKADIDLLESATVDSTTAPRFHARNVWLFSFYLAGMRFSDVIQLKKKEILDGRLPYTMGKNNKPLNLKVPDKAMEIVTHYQREHPKGKYLFPDMDRTKPVGEYATRRRVRSINRNINRQLDHLAKQLGIEKRLSMHIARHSFATIAGDKISIQLLQKLYRHGDIRTTINYQQSFIHKDMDEALDLVIG